MKKVLLILSVIISISASKNDKTESLIGIWVLEKSEILNREKIVSYKKVKEYKKGNSLQFKKDNELIVRETLKRNCITTSSFTYSNKNWIWNLKNNSKLSLIYENGKNKIEKKLIIVSLNDSKMKVKWLN